MEASVPDRVMLALGLIDGKTWPEDAAEPGPHYWRVEHGETTIVHAAWCGCAKRSKRKQPWFWADGQAPARLLVWMRRYEHLGFRPCRNCWATILGMENTLNGVAPGHGEGLLLALTTVLERGSAS